MASKRTLVITAHAEGVRETLAAFRGMPKEASEAIRAHSQVIAGKFATAVQSAGQREGHQAAAVASTAKAARDRVPVVQVGGTKRVGRRRKPAWKLLFGSEFGSNTYTQFPRRHVGTAGIWIFPTIDTESPMMMREWQSAADDVIRAFTAGGE